MPKRKPPRLFILSSATAEVGSGVDDDLHPQGAIIKLNLVGKWTRGGSATIPVLFDAATGPELADLIRRAAEQIPTP